MGNPIKIIISDTHIGAGFEESGNVLEDFISDVAFLQFLADLARESGERRSPLELIINGDFVEMLQTPASETFDPLARYEPDDYDDPTEAGAVRKIGHVLQGHPVIFAALADFISPGPPRRQVTMIKGNHDPEQYWPAWQAAVREAVGATGDLVDLLHFEAVSINRDGLYVEHGNQYAELANRFDDFETPLDPDDPGRLALPIGSLFVIKAINGIERQRFWVDSVHPVAALAWYLLRWDFAFAIQTLIALLAAAIDIIGEGVIGRRPEGREAMQLLQELRDARQASVLAAQYERDPAFRGHFHRRVQRALEAVQAGERPPGWDEGGSELAADQIAASLVEFSIASLREAAQRKATETGARLVSFGHTHAAEEMALAGGGLYINTGAWVWRGDFDRADEATWRDLIENPQNYARNRTLHYARIDYDDAGQPVGRLLVYKPEGGAEPERPQGCWPALLRFLQEARRGRASAAQLTAPGRLDARARRGRLRHFGRYATMHSRTQLSNVQRRVPWP